MTKRIKDKFDGWKVLDNEKLKERRQQMKPPYNIKRRMAKELGIDPNLLKKYEELQIFPSLDTFKKLCLFLQLSADELLGLEIIDDDSVD